VCNKQTFCDAVFELVAVVVAAATAVAKPFKLIVYPDAEHDFVLGGEHCNSKDLADAFGQTGEMLKMFLSN